MDSNAGVELSNEAVAAIFGAGGFLLALLTGLFRKKDGATKCLFHEDFDAKNESAHKELFRRVIDLEKGHAAAVAKVDSISDRLDRIEDTLFEIRDHLLKD